MGIEGWSGRPQYAGGEISRLWVGGAILTTGEKFGDQFAAAADAETAINFFHVIVDGVAGKGKTACDLLYAFAGEQAEKDLALAGGEFVDVLGSGDVGSLAMEPVDFFRYDMEDADIARGEHGPIEAAKESDCAEVTVSKRI